MKIRNIIAHAAIGGVIFLIGAFIHDVMNLDGLGNTFAAVGIGYGVISLCMLVVPFYKKIAPKINTAIHEKAKLKAYDDILKFKKLLDEKIITQDEFDVKARELKTKIL